MASATKPNIKGGDYTAYDTGDGWYVLKDIPTLAPVKKGQMYAPEDISTDWFNGAIKFGQEAYNKSKIAYPIHLTHTDDQGIHNPEFGGYFVPTKVKEMDLPDLGNVPVVHSDFKIKKKVFDKMESGELGYVSPEVRSWRKGRISSVALLDSIPPHNPFPLMTIGKVVTDPAAKFEAELPAECAIARFSDGFERVTFDPREDDKESEKSKLEAKPMADEKKPVQDEQHGKPNAAPVEQPPGAKPAVAQAGAKMEQEARDAARFAAMEDRVAAAEKRLSERDAADKAKELTAKALESMRGYQIGDRAKAQIAKFAQEGEAQLNAFIETLKEVTPKDSPRTFAAAEAASSVAINDPALAKFSQQGPEKLEMAARFASEYRTLKSHGAGRGMTIKEEEYVRFQMEQAEGNERHWDISIGTKN